VLGKLTQQDHADEPASELLKKIEKEKAQLVKEGKIKKQAPLPEITHDEKPVELPEGWEWVRLNDAIDVRDGTHDTPKEASGENTYPLVTSKNFENGNIKFDEAKRISAEDHFEISKRSNVERFDILFSMIGGNLGNQVMVTDDRPFSIKNVALFKYYNKEYTSPFFVKKIMEHVAIDLQNMAIGGAQPFVSLGFLRNLIIALPPLAEQHRIVSKVDELFAICDALKERLREAQVQKNLLAEAVVEQALTTQPKGNVSYTINEQISMAAEPE
jgi:type I restriction enzyme S subunit